MKRKWSKDLCLKEAHSCKTPKEFERKSVGAYIAARKYGWIYEKEFSFLKNTRLRWTKEDCIKEAAKYNTWSEFRKNSVHATNAAYRYGWYKEFDFLKRMRKSTINRKPAGYWTKERCEEESKKYKCRKDFFNGSSGAYQKSLEKGWIDDFYWLEDRLHNISKRTGNSNTVYAYIFVKLMAVYIGRTNNMKRRDREHLFASEKDDTVMRFCKLNCIPLPEPTILEKNLSLEDSTEKEEYYLNVYRERHYYIINKAKCGKGSSSVGRVYAYKWTYETCYAEAKKYEYAKDFQKSRTAYNKARENGWLKYYTWLKPSRKDNYWNEITCREEAEKYTSRSAFRSGSPVACRIAYNKGWIDSYTWLVRPTVWNKGLPGNIKWTYELCKQEASKYYSRSEFLEKNGSAYYRARKEGWLDDFFPKKKTDYK